MKEIDPEMSLSLSMMCVKGISMMEKNLEEEEEDDDDDDGEELRRRRRRRRT